MPSHRLTAMFSATMPAGVELIVIMYKLVVRIILFDMDSNVNIGDVLINRLEEQKIHFINYVAIVESLLIHR